MGEDAMYEGQMVKIGTCEDMYYLRADQAKNVRQAAHSLNAWHDRFQIRFRFPWPDEDNVKPGAFDKAYDRSYGLYGVSMPEGVEHGSVQFLSNNPTGLLLSIPCPLGKEGAETLKTVGLTVHKNGWPGDVQLCQQKFIKRDNGEEYLAVIARCGGCHSKVRLESFEDALPLIEALKKDAQRKATRGVPDEWCLKVAARIEEGYRVQR